jgi:hypothetical protein
MDWYAFMFIQAAIRTPRFLRASLNLPTTLSPSAQSSECTEFRVHRVPSAQSSECTEYRPRWVTEWGFNNRDQTCQLNEQVRIHQIQVEREAFAEFKQQKRLAALSDRLEPLPIYILRHTDLAVGSPVKTGTVSFQGGLRYFDRILFVLRWTPQNANLYAG